MTRVLVVGLGGTITMTASAVGGAVAPSLSPAQLLEAIPTLAAIARIETKDLYSTASANLTLASVRRLAEVLKDAAADGFSGAVVLMGTDVMEEIAFALDLVSLPPMALVFTGAARGADRIGADGLANVAAAVRVAVDPAASNLGALVVFNDEIHAARFVRKVHTTRTDGFSSEPFGPLGLIAEDRVVWALRPATTQRKLILGPRDAIVPILYLSLGATLKEVSAITQDADALVVAGLGGGHAPAALVEHLALCAARVPVALTSRIGIGVALERSYGYPGSETDLIARGLIPTGLMGPLRARIVLQFLLSTAAAKDIRPTFLAFCRAGA